MYWLSDFGLGSFGALCKISNVKIFKRLLLTQISFNFDKTLWNVWYSGGIQNYTFLGICQIKKNVMALSNFLNTGLWWAENVKMPLLLLFFHSISAKFHEDLAYHMEVQAVSIPGDLPSFEKFVSLWNFNLGVNGKVLKCWESWSWKLFI